MSIYKLEIRHGHIIALEFGYDSDRFRSAWHPVESGTLYLHANGRITDCEDDSSEWAMQWREEETCLNCVRDDGSCEKHGKE